MNFSFFFCQDNHANPSLCLFFVSIDFFYLFRTGTAFILVKKISFFIFISPTEMGVGWVEGEEGIMMVNGRKRLFALRI